MKEKKKEKQTEAPASAAEEKERAEQPAEGGESVIDRESMTDEEYIAVLEEKVGQCVAETVSATVRRRTSTVVWPVSPMYPL